MLEESREGRGVWNGTGGCLSYNVQIQHNSRLNDVGTNLLMVKNGRIGTASLRDLPFILNKKSTLVLNNAMTLPAMFMGKLAGQKIELRLVSNLNSDFRTFNRWYGILLDGNTDWRTRTEFRTVELNHASSSTIQFSDGCGIKITDQIRKSLWEVTINPSNEHPTALDVIFSHGQFIQYSHLTHELQPWDVQSIVFTIPAALEPPSSHFQLTWQLLSELREKGHNIVYITHGSGVSDLGYPELDHFLPFPELYRVGKDAATMLNESVDTSYQIVAIGTSVTRALEHNFNINQQFNEGIFLATNRLSSKNQAKVVEAMLTGMHLPNTSHYDLMRGFLPDQMVHQSFKYAKANNFRWHEYGDLTLVFNHFKTRKSF